MQSTAPFHRRKAAHVVKHRMHIFSKNASKPNTVEHLVSKNDLPGDIDKLSRASLYTVDSVMLDL